MTDLNSAQNLRTHGYFTVHAQLIERFIFNYRLRPEALAAHLPVSYLRPQVFGGWSIVSFCLIRFQKLRLFPLPSLPNMSSLSCAYRCGVTDLTGAEPVPSVYLLRRYTDRAFISQLGPWIFSSAIPQIRSSLALPTQPGESRTVHVGFPDGRPLFRAEVKPSAHPEKLDSQIFASLDDLAHFISAGVSSYTQAIDKKKLARVDLRKEDATYESYDTTIEHNLLASLWPEANLTFDSVVRATGRQYIWTYEGLTAEE